MTHLSQRLVDRPIVPFVSGLAMLGLAALLRPSPVGIPVGVLVAGVGFAMAGLGAMLTIGTLAAAGVDYRSSVERVRAWIADGTSHPHPTGHHAH